MSVRPLVTFFALIFLALSCFSNSATTQALDVIIDYREFVQSHLRDELNVKRQTPGLSVAILEQVPTFVANNAHLLQISVRPDDSVVVQVIESTIYHNPKIIDVQFPDLDAYNAAVSPMSDFQVSKNELLVLRSSPKKIELYDFNNYRELAYSNLTPQMLSYLGGKNLIPPDAIPTMSKIVAIELNADSSVTLKMTYAIGTSVGLQKTNYQIFNYEHRNVILESLDAYNWLQRGRTLIISEADFIRTEIYFRYRVSGFGRRFLKKTYEQLADQLADNTAHTVFCENIFYK